MAELALKRLTLVFPPDVETELTELLLALAPPLPGFTSLEATGHGADFASASVREQVRGRVARCVLFMVIPGERVAPLITLIGKALPARHVSWWVEPVEAFGRLA
jgi:hypothetical protein